MAEECCGCLKMGEFQIYGDRQVYIGSGPSGGVAVDRDGDGRIDEVHYLDPMKKIPKECWQIKATLFRSALMFDIKAKLWVLKAAIKSGKAQRTVETFDLWKNRGKIKANVIRYKEITVIDHGQDGTYEYMSFYNPVSKVRALIDIVTSHEGMFGPFQVNMALRPHRTIQKYLDVINKELKGE